MPVCRKVCETFKLYYFFQQKSSQSPKTENSTKGYQLHCFTKSFKLAEKQICDCEITICLVRGET